MKQVNFNKSSILKTVLFLALATNFSWRPLVAVRSSVTSASTIERSEVDAKGNVTRLNDRDIKACEQSFAVQYMMDKDNKVVAKVTPKEKSEAICTDGCFESSIAVEQKTLTQLKADSSETREALMGKISEICVNHKMAVKKNKDGEDEEKKKAKEQKEAADKEEAAKKERERKAKALAKAIKSCDKGEDGKSLGNEEAISCLSNRLANLADEVGEKGKAQAATIADDIHKRLIAKLGAMLTSKNETVRAAGRDLADGIDFSSIDSEYVSETRAANWQKEIDKLVTLSIKRDNAQEAGERIKEKGADLQAKVDDIRDRLAQAKQDYDNACNIDRQCGPNTPEAQAVTQIMKYEEPQLLSEIRNIRASENRDYAALKEAKLSPADMADYVGGFNGAVLQLQNLNTNLIRSAGAQGRGNQIYDSSDMPSDFMTQRQRGSMVRDAAGFPIPSSLSMVNSTGLSSMNSLNGMNSINSVGSFNPSMNLANRPYTGAIPSFQTGIQQQNNFGPQSNMLRPAGGGQVGGNYFQGFGSSFGGTGMVNGGISQTNLTPAQQISPSGFRANGI